jgi:hypothetical protein
MRGTDWIRRTITHAPEHPGQSPGETRLTASSSRATSPVRSTFSFRRASCCALLVFAWGVTCAYLDSTTNGWKGPTTVGIPTFYPNPSTYREPEVVRRDGDLVVLYSTNSHASRWLTQRTEYGLSYYGDTQIFDSMQVQCGYPLRVLWLYRSRLVRPMTPRTSWSEHRSRSLVEGLSLPRSIAPASGRSIPLVPDVVNFPVCVAALYVPWTLSCTLWRMMRLRRRVNRAMLAGIAWSDSWAILAQSVAPPYRA